MDVNEFANFLARELLLEQFAPFEGIGVHSGVPTRTTSTLTPTTLKNIEQSVMGITNDNQIHLPYQAGFVPPPYPLEEHSQDREASQESCSSNSNTSWPVSGSHGYGADDLDSKSSTSLDPPPLTSSSSSHGGGGHHGSFAAGAGTGDTASSRTLKGSGAAGATASGTRGSGRRNVGGRRPHKPSNLSPEEEEKRRVRRERNKQAAARCRRRREDHTNELVDETDQLEQRRQTLQKEIQELQQEKDELEFLLETHREHCRLQGRRSPLDMKPTGLIDGNTNAALLLPIIKTEPEEELSQQQPTPPQQQQLKLAPNDAQNEAHPFQGVPPGKKLKLSNVIADSLNTPPTVSLSLSRPGSLNVKPEEFQLGGVSGGTPSSGLFNFESLMQGGTGLTPIAAPISFSANRNPLELITPTSTEPSKLFSL
ncbi:transcription factor kayak isoform X2 [Anopheles cruzii]|uniref:transcription factor kayak isoform X2 n=1 Tax=Anopheles cruzii TaxID=68878 RepID=UPI0022EC837C|nr:transcription factor kayak isoform X2 [Anopheles cruzii]